VETFDYYLKPEIGDQVAVGFYEMLFKNNLKHLAEAYYKTISNMVDFKRGTNLVMDENIEKDIVNVKGKAYGLELVLKKTVGKFSIQYWLHLFQNFYKKAWEPSATKL